MAINWWMEGFKCASKRKPDALNIDEVFQAHYAMVLSMQFSLEGATYNQVRAATYARDQFCKGWKAANERR